MLALRCYTWASSSCGEWRLLSRRTAQASHRRGFSCCRARTVGRLGFSNCDSRALEHGLNSGGAWAQVLCGRWDLRGPGIKPMPPALVGGFVTTEPPEKSFQVVFVFLPWECFAHGFSKFNVHTKHPAMLCSVAQSCLTLCDPMDRGQPGSSVHADSPGKNAGVGCHALLQDETP